VAAVEISSSVISLLVSFLDTDGGRLFGKFVAVETRTVHHLSLSLHDCQEPGVSDTLVSTVFFLLELLELGGGGMDKRSACHPVRSTPFYVT
jgi:hypothetical protein